MQAGISRTCWLNNQDFITMSERVLCIKSIIQAEFACNSVICLHTEIFYRVYVFVVEDVSSLVYGQYVSDVVTVRVHQHGDSCANQHQQRHARPRRLRAALRTEAPNTH